ncbi:MAG: hypothetical protein K0R03_1952 [Moraxellaceae bacterium]|jgi:hypothetical protein|nr:hypothetical protein [Moraxellaceae bacterium]
MKILAFCALLALAAAWLLGMQGAREKHPLDANGCHTSPRTGIYHCHSNGEPHPADEDAAAFAEAEATYLPPGVTPAAAPSR